jgi:hypothetical protein
MQRRLASLGFAMAFEPIPNLKGFDLDALDDDGGMNGHYHGTPGGSMRKATSSHTACKSAHASTNGNAAPSSPFLHRPLKRQRLESPLPKNIQIEPPTSRDAMPPPQKPLSRMRSVRKIIPSLRKKFATGRSTQASDYSERRGGDVQMYEEEEWNGGRVSTVRDEFDEQMPYMSGALPAEHSSQGPTQRESQLLSSVGVDNNGADFTFRASSPVKMGKKSNSRQASQLPNEPSYIRLMDGLSRNNGFELGLKDPREGNSNTYQPQEQFRQVKPYGQDPRRYGDTRRQEHWSPEPPSPQQLSREPFLQAASHRGSAHTNRTNHNHNRISQESVQHPVTPAPRRYQQPGQQIESVVSPYVESNNHTLSHFSQPRIAETKDSSNRFAGYRSQKPQIIEPETNWREPRGLNGLSFFESAVTSRYSPNQRSHERQQIDRPPPAPRYQSCNLNSRGFIVRPEAERSPFSRDSAYGSSRPQLAYPVQQQAYSNSAIPFPSFNRSSQSRTGQIPSAMPSIVTGRSPVRTKPQWEALQRMGVRSSRHEFSKHSYVDPGREFSSSVGRRIVRR